MTGFGCWTAVPKKKQKNKKNPTHIRYIIINEEHSYKCKLLTLMHLKRGFACFLPSLPASCSCILSISMGVVTMTWHMPAPQPASISLNTVSPFLLRVRHVLNKPPLKIINTYCPFPRRSSHRVCLPVFGKVVPEEVIGSQLDCLLRGNQGQIYSST